MTAAPPVERLVRRLAECPPEFLAEPWPCDRGEAAPRVAAVVADLLEDLGLPEPPGERELRAWARGEGKAEGKAEAKERNRLRLTLVACWLCHDPDLRAARRFAPAVRGFLAGAIPPLAELVAAERFVSDPDRREELARLLLAALGLVPAGERESEAADRLRALSSVERAGVLRDTRAQQERARKLREKMEAERARQAAARYASE